MLPPQLSPMLRRSFRRLIINHGRIKVLSPIKFSRNENLAVQQQVEALIKVNNYALRMQLQQAEHGNTMPERFNPDVF